MTLCLYPHHDDRAPHQADTGPRGLVVFSVVAGVEGAGSAASEAQAGAEGELHIPVGVGGLLLGG